jgi:hypothetical protein
MATGFLDVAQSGLHNQSRYPYGIVFERDIEYLRIYGENEPFQEISEHGIFHGITTSAYK